MPLYDWAKEGDSEEGITRVWSPVRAIERSFAYSPFAYQGREWPFEFLFRRF